MSLREFYEWIKYYNQEPFMADRMEIQIATLSLIVTSYGASKNKRPKHEDFMISKKEKPVLTAKEQYEQIINAFKSV